jgi:hypothetical protein
MKMRINSSRVLFVILILTLFVASIMTYPQPKTTTDANVKENEGFMELNPVTTRPTRADEIWPMHLNNPLHTSYTTAFGPTTNEVLWDSATGNPTYSSPCVADSMVFIGSDEHMCAYYENNGTLAWRTYTIEPVTGTFGVACSPAYSDGYIYFGGDRIY